MNVIDIVCLALILIAALIGAKRGLFIIFVQFLALVVSALAARIASIPVAQFFYTEYIQAEVTARLNGLLPSGSVSGGIRQVIESVFQSLPESIYKVVDFLRLIPSPFEDANEILTVTQIESQYVSPILTKVMSFITMAVIFVVLSVILRLIVFGIDKAVFKKKKGMISTGNRLGGFLLGMVKGAIPVFFICVILNLIAPALNQNALMDQVGNSYLCQLIADILK